MRQTATKKSLLSRVRRAAGRFATAYRKSIVRCPNCSREIDASAHVERVEHSVGILKLDTRQVLVRCPKCKGFVRAYVYPLFNRIPPMQAVASLAAITLLSVVVVSFA